MYMSRDLHKIRAVVHGTRGVSLAGVSIALMFFLHIVSLPFGGAKRWLYLVEGLTYDLEIKVDRSQLSVERGSDRTTFDLDQVRTLRFEPGGTVSVMGRAHPTVQLVLLLADGERLVFGGLIPDARTQELEAWVREAIAAAEPRGSAVDIPQSLRAARRMPGETDR